MNPTRKSTQPGQNHFVACVYRFSKSKKAWVIILWRQVVPHPWLQIFNFNSKYCWIRHIFFTGKRPLFSFLMSYIFNFNFDYLGWLWSSSSQASGPSSYVLVTGTPSSSSCTTYGLTPKELRYLQVWGRRLWWNWLDFWDQFENFEWGMS